MYKLVILLLAAGCGSSDQCDVNTPCSTGSGNHYQFCNGGADDCYYLSGDGHRYHCVTCGDCSDAQSAVSDWCEAQPANVGGTTGNSGLTCSAVTSCPSNSRTYQACASLTGTQCTYQGSDGTSFDCNGCGDCTGAVQNVLAWCNGSAPTSNGSTTSGVSSDTTCFEQANTACQTCCAANHGDGSNYYTDTYLTCGCGYCTAQCNTAGDVCHGGGTQTSDCATCLSASGQQNCQQQVLSSCAANAACSGYLTCIESCPT